jgi:hypothetical protein
MNVVHRGLHSNKSKKGRGQTISSYYFQVDDFDPFAGPKKHAGRLAAPFWERKHTQQWADESASAWRYLFRHDAVMKALRVNRLLLGRHIQVDVHYGFLSGFVHPSKRGYEAIFGGNAPDRMGEFARLFSDALLSSRLDASGLVLSLAPRPESPSAGDLVAGPISNLDRMADWAPPPARAVAERGADALRFAAERIHSGRERAESRQSLQAYLDGELSASEAKGITDLLGKDPESAALLTELQQTNQALAGFEDGLKLPESREFFWSKIKRGIGSQESRASAVERSTTVPWSVRLRRFLVPASGLAVVGILLFGFVIYSPLEMASYAKWAIYTSLYISNYMFMRDAANYFAADVETNPFLHTWSLAIEEQFYLFWPALVVLSLSRMKRIRHSSNTWS